MMKQYLKFSYAYFIFRKDHNVSNLSVIMEINEDVYCNRKIVGNIL